MINQILEQNIAWISEYIIPLILAYIAAGFVTTVAVKVFFMPENLPDPDEFGFIMICWAGWPVVLPIAILICVAQIPDVVARKIRKWLETKRQTE